MIERIGPKGLWVTANLIGIALFLELASQSWIEPELADVPGASMGNAFGWFLTAVPVLAIFAVGHLVAAGAALKTLFRDWRATPLLMVLLTAVLWVWATWFDNLHHGI